MKWIVLAAAIASAAPGCKKGSDTDKEPSGKATATPPAQPAPAPEPTEPTGPTAAMTLERFNRCKAAVNARDLDAISKCYAAEGAEMVALDSTGEDGAAEGAAAIAEAYKRAFGAATAAQSTPQLTLAGPGWVAAINVDTATVDGRKLGVLGAQLVWLDDSRAISRDLRLVDEQTVAAQLGKAPAPMAPKSAEPWPEPVVAEVTSDKAGQIETNVSIVENVERAIAEGAIETVAAHVADGVTFRYAPHKAALEGKQAYTESLSTLGEMFSKMERKLLGAMGAGDWVVAHSLVTATPAADLPQAPGSAGKPVSTHQISFYKLEDGAITAHWVFENSAQWGVQLGARPR
jgi:ketosteroid isomerase-like protein